MARSPNRDRDPSKVISRTKTSLKDYNTTSGIYCARLQHSVLARSDTSTPSNPGVTCPPVCSVVTTALRWKVELHRLGCWRIPRGRRPANSSCSSSRMCAFFFFLFTLPFTLSLTGGSSVSSLISHQKVRPTSQLIVPDAGEQATKTSWSRKTASGQKRSRHLKSSFLLCWFVFVTIIYIWPKNEIR